MVGSSDDKRVRAAVREHAGAELSDYRSFTVEYETLVDSGHVGPLTRQQARTNCEDFVKSFVKFARNLRIFSRVNLLKTMMFALEDFSVP